MALFFRYNFVLNHSLEVKEHNYLICVHGRPPCSWFLSHTLVVVFNAILPFQLSSATFEHLLSHGQWIHCWFSDATQSLVGSSLQKFFKLSANPLDFTNRSDVRRWLPLGAFLIWIPPPPQSAGGFWNIFQYKLRLMLGNSSIPCYYYLKKLLSIHL